MTCREAVGLVTSYLDGALSAADHDRLERHLEECPHCREHVKQIETTIRIAGEVRTDDLDTQAQTDLISLFRRWRHEDDGD
jgi:anti-sigma factor RsiW